MRLSQKHPVRVINGILTWSECYIFSVWTHGTSTQQYGRITSLDRSGFYYLFIEDVRSQ